MVGRVGLYNKPFYTRQRPDSSRSQAARSLVACAKQCGSRTAAGLTRAKRRGSCTASLPAPASVQTRAALKRHSRRVACAKRRGSGTAAGLRARSGEEATQPPGCVRGAERKPHCGRVDTREAVWKPHCGRVDAREAVWKPHCGRRHPGRGRDPPGSDLWSGGSCCTISPSAPASVQTRAAPKRRRVGLRARSGLGCRGSSPA